MREKVFLLILAIAVCVMSQWLQKSYIPAQRNMYYAPPTEYLHLFSGNFRSSVADYFYIKGIMAVTDDLQKGQSRMQWVQKNMSLAVTLDPRMSQAYFFGGIAVAQGEESSLRQGITFLQKGCEKQPKNWRIWCWLGFAYFQLQEYFQAAKCYQKAAELPGSPQYLTTMQPMLYYRADKVQMGIHYLQGILHTLKSKKQLKIIEKKLLWLQNIALLEKAVAQYQSYYGYLPKNLQDLIAKNYLSAIPEDPFGKGYYLTAKGKVASHFRK